MSLIIRMMSSICSGRRCRRAVIVDLTISEIALFFTLSDQLFKRDCCCAVVTCLFISSQLFAKTLQLFSASKNAQRLDRPNSSSPPPGHANGIILSAIATCVWTQPVYPPLNCRSRISLLGAKRRWRQRRVDWEARQGPYLTSWRVVQSLSDYPICVKQPLIITTVNERR